MWLAQMLFNLGRKPEAVKALQEAISLEPYRPEY
ncbi:MAG: tetratricopeptide repeat protein [Terriglobia bacterium]